MPIASVVMQIVQHIQFVGMLSQLDINWPSEWFDVTSFLNISSLEFENLLGGTKVPVITRRMIFVMVSIGVPLIINVLLLVIFQPVTVVLWYLALCVGTVLLCAGLAGKYLPGTGVEEAGATDPDFFIYLGGGLVGFALLVLVVVLIIRKSRKNAEEGAEENAYVDNVKYYRRFHRGRALQHCIVFFCLLIFGLVFSGILTLSIPRTGTDTIAENPLVVIAGIVLLVMAFVACIYMVLNWSKKGRRMTQRGTRVLKTNILLVMLTLISMSYIPTISYAITNFMCREYTCPVGTKFNPYADRPTESYDTSQSRYCDPCTFNTTVAPTCGRNVSSDFAWCPAFAESRMWKSPDTSCADEATVYFYIASVIVLIIYAGGIPALYYRQIQYLTVHVKDALIGDPIPDETENDVWIRRMGAVRPVASSLYDPFSFGRRYFVLVQLMYRLLITFVITVAAAFSRAAVVFVLVLHGGICVILALARPYVTFGEQLLAMGLAICNVLNSVYAIAIWKSSESIPDYTAYVFFALNGVVPAIILIVGTILARRARLRKAREAEEQADQAKHDELEEREKRHDMGGVKIAVPNRPAAKATNDPYGGNGAAQARGPGTAPPAYNPHDPYGGTQNYGNGDDDEDWDSELDSWDDSEDDAPRPAGSPARRRQNGALGGNPYLTMSAAERKVARDKRNRKRRNEVAVSVLNEHSTNTMNKAFMAMGVFFVIALGISVLGLLRSREEPYLVGSHSRFRTPTTVFAGYGSWDEFTANCCCLEQQTPSPDFTRAERWVCGNGKTLERGRVAKSGDSGLLIRDMCATSFNEQCQPFLDGSGNIVASCPSASLANRLSSTEAKELYW